MGSGNFERTYYGSLSAEAAYRDLCDDARAEYGHSTTNGTIATTEGVIVVDSPPLTLAQARAVANPRLDHLQKWEPCEALPLVKETAAQWAPLPPQDVTLTLSGADYNDYEKVRRALAKALKVTPEQVERFRVLDPNTYCPRMTVEARVQAEAPGEKTETRYFVMTDRIQTVPPWESGHPSQAAARAALDKVLRYDGHYGVPPVEVEIIGVTRRASGAPLVKATVSARKITATFTVSLGRLVSEATAGTKHAGWYFYGWVAS